MVAPIGDYSYLYGAASRWNKCKHDIFLRMYNDIYVYSIWYCTHTDTYCYAAYSDHCQQWNWSSLNHQLSIKNNITQIWINRHLTIDYIMTQPLKNYHSTIEQWLSKHFWSLSANLCHRSLSPPARWCCDASHRVHRHRNGCRLVHYLIDGWWWKIELVGGWQWVFNGFIMVNERFMNGSWWFIMNS